MACSKDRYAATYGPDLGPASCQVADFTDIQTAIKRRDSETADLYLPYIENKPLVLYCGG
jgi:hypothetical protein